MRKLLFVLLFTFVFTLLTGCRAEKTLPDNSSNISVPDISTEENREPEEVMRISWTASAWGIRNFRYGLRQSWI